MSWTWKWFDMLIVVGAVAIGIGVWFIPNMEANPEVQALYEHQRELREKRLAREAREAQIEKEREELGLVFVTPESPEESSR